MQFTIHDCQTVDCQHLNQIKDPKIEIYTCKINLLLLSSLQTMDSTSISKSLATCGISIHTFLNFFLLSNKYTYKDIAAKS